LRRCVLWVTLYYSLIDCIVLTYAAV